ncbi:MAG TPA: 2TM domain-containing protein [Chitinophagaceae bacterium]|nr:2TM domain-containing protein [Chitinophagaceae bacterium]
MQTLTDTQLRELARKRVDFRNHLIVYCVVNAALWMLWWVTGGGYIWPIWPLAGWGIALIFHYVFEYRPSKYLSEEEEYRRLKKRLGEPQA